MKSRLAFLYIFAIVLMSNSALATVTTSDTYITIESESFTPATLYAEIANNSIFANPDTNTYMNNRTVRISSGGEFNITGYEMRLPYTTQRNNIWNEYGTLIIVDSDIIGWNQTTNSADTSSGSKSYVYSENANIEVHDCSFSYLGRTSQTFYGGFGVTGGDGWTIYNVNASFCAIGIGATNSHDATIHDCTVTNSSSRSIYLDGTPSTCYNNLIENNTVVNSGNGGITFEGANSTIRNNECYGGTANIQVIWDSYNVTVDGNYVHDSHPHAFIDIQGAALDQAVLFATVINNTLHGGYSYGGTNPHGIYFHNYMGGNHVAQNNTIYGMAGYGIQISDNYNVTLIGNNISDTAANMGIGIGNGLGVYGVVIDGDYYYDSRGYDIDIDPNSVYDYFYINNTYFSTFNAGDTGNTSTIYNALNSFSVRQEGNSHTVYIIGTSGQVYETDETLTLYENGSFASVSGIGTYYFNTTNLSILPVFSGIGSIDTSVTSNNADSITWLETLTGALDHKNITYASDNNASLQWSNSTVIQNVTSIDGINSFVNIVYGTGSYQIIESGAATPEEPETPLAVISYTGNELVDYGYLEEYSVTANKTITTGYLQVNAVTVDTQTNNETLFFGWTPDVEAGDYTVSMNITDGLTWDNSTVLNVNVFKGTDGTIYAGRTWTYTWNSATGIFDTVVENATRSDTVITGVEVMA